MKKTPTVWSAFFRAPSVAVAEGVMLFFASVGSVSRGRAVLLCVCRACFPIKPSNMVDRDRSYLRTLRAPENDEFFGRSFVARPRFGEGEDKSLETFFEFAAHVTLVRRFSQRERQQRQARVVADGGHLVVPQFALLALVGRVVQLDDQQRLERQ